MFVLLVLFGTYKLCSTVAFYVRAYAPTNIAVYHLSSRRGLKWALPAAAVATPVYWGLGYAVTTLLEQGGPGWLNLVAALMAWNGLKFAMLGLWTPILAAVATLPRRRAAHLLTRTRSRNSADRGSAAAHRGAAFTNDEVTSVEYLAGSN